MKAVLPRYGGKKYTAYPEMFFRTKSENAYDYKPYRNKRSVWAVATKPYKEAHFATFPVDLIEPCILAGSRPGGLVIDPFCGSGTTGIAALKHGRKFLGIDINPAYCEIAERRLARGWEKPKSPVKFAGRFRFEETQTTFFDGIKEAEYK
jgi:site-specific DNA-methyltransferase (adenine-specific)